MTAGGLTPDPDLPPAVRAILADVVDLLVEVTGEDAEWAAGVRAGSRLDGDLLLDSLELAALDERLRQRYGAGVDLPALFAGLDLDQLIELTVGELARHVAATGTPAPARAGP